MSTDQSNRIRVRRTAYTWQSNWQAVDRLTAVIKANGIDISGTRVLEMVIEAGIEALRKKYKDSGSRALTPKPEASSRLVWDEAAREQFGE